jgi:hypothetical protein
MCSKVSNSTFSIGGKLKLNKNKGKPITRANNANINVITAKPFKSEGKKSSTIIDGFT